ncbi:MAG TPA: translation initiation factor IF-2 N-terminal domain-containing protein [Pseudonocardiaceae bacterium]
MSNRDVPAVNTGGRLVAPSTGEGAGEPVSGAVIPELPPKMRVHALAKLIGTNSRKVLSTLADLGHEVRSAQSSVSREIATQVVEALLPPAEEPDETQVTPVVEPVVQPVVHQEKTPVVPLAPVFAPPTPVFLPPQPPEPAPAASAGSGGVVTDEDVAEAEETPGEEPEQSESSGRRRRRRGRRGRGRGRNGQTAETEEQQPEQPEQAEQAEPAAAVEENTTADEGAQSGTPTEAAETTEATAEGEENEGTEGTGQQETATTSSTRRRRRRRRRKGSGDEETALREDDPPNTVVHVRESRPEAKAETQGSTNVEDEVRSVKGSTRLEAKRQRRRDGREAGRRRAPVLSEAEFLARRESVERKMVVRQRGDVTQIAVLEDGVLVEHFVTSSGNGSMVGNVYLGRVQNVLPSMEAAFVDIGRGRNAVLYAGEVDWDAAGLEGKARKIEQALKTGDSVLVQVTKDPVGHKGARLTTQISLPGRFLVYVPGGGVTGISRKLPDTERRRLKEILKRIVPDNAGVIIRTASEGISEEELARDVRRLQAQWEVIKEKAETPNAVAPQLLYEEPDLLIKVVRDLFTEDFSALIVQGDQAWDTIEAYVNHVAPDLLPRLRKHVDKVDVFTTYRIDEQITKALDRKVWLPSGGYLVIDRTEAMTVIDVNTGKFTGSGGNLEETVTRNNLEAAEEIVRQLRLRDIGGIIVVDFIDMVLESNRDLVLRRLTECLGRDRTRHQVAEVTSLGLVQMTRKRVGTGLLEAFSTTCEHCRGRGVLVSTEPVHSNGGKNSDAGRRNRGRGRNGQPAEPAAETTRQENGRPEAELVAESKPTSEPAPEPETGAAEAGTAAAAAQPEPEPAPVTEVDRQEATRSEESEPAGRAEAAGSTVPEPEAQPEPVAAAHMPQVESLPTTPPVGERARSAESRPPTPEVPAQGQPLVTVATGVRRRARRAAARPAGPPMTVIKEG